MGCHSTIFVHHPFFSRFLASRVKYRNSLIEIIKDLLVCFLVGLFRPWSRGLATGLGDTLEIDVRCLKTGHEAQFSWGVRKRRSLLRMGMRSISSLDKRFRGELGEHHVKICKNIIFSHALTSEIFPRTIVCSR